ncbi:hypothetical protein KCU91_g7, partial [Aureobasidium melanogenum]
LIRPRWCYYEDSYAMVMHSTLNFVLSIPSPYAPVMLSILIMHKLTSKAHGSVRTLHACARALGGMTVRPRIHFYLFAPSRFLLQRLYSTSIFPSLKCRVEAVVGLAAIEYGRLRLYQPGLASLEVLVRLLQWT